MVSPTKLPPRIYSRINGSFKNSKAWSALVGEFIGEASVFNNGYLLFKNIPVILPPGKLL